MKIPMSWLREWVSPDADAETLAGRLTMAGLEVDSIETQGDRLGGIVVGEVLNVEPHPNADRLRVCQVGTGGGEAVEVVCGAPNVRQGMKSAFAAAGTRLPDGHKLRRSKIRGVVSNGMLCSAAELGLGSDADGILDLPEGAAAGDELARALDLPDAVLDIDITPNRGDCFSLLGVARDTAALFATALQGPELGRIDPSIDDRYPVERPVPEACPRFAHQVVRGIDPAARSPLWMQERLRRAGLRPISPVVDVTNYVMLELGQPLHAYDKDRLSGPVRPRYAKAGESVVLLDERKVELRDGTVVITDDSGVIGLAGIMGGFSTMVTDTTTDVFFEAAYWPPAVMAGQARSYGMHTDASLRFERGVDPQGQARAVSRAVELLTTIAGGRAGPLVDDADEQELPRREPITLTSERLRQVLGLAIGDDDVVAILEGLQFAVSGSGGAWQVTAPGFRFDILREDDLVEEVARIYGYDRIPEATGSSSMPLPMVPGGMLDADSIADALVARDYNEVITYSFVDAAFNQGVCEESSALVLSNPISAEMSEMRLSLLGGLLASAAGNVARQQNRVRLFEIGNSYHGTTDAPIEIRRLAALALGPRYPEDWKNKAENLDFFDIKADLEALLSGTNEAASFSFVAADVPAFQPGQSAHLVRGDRTVGTVGKIHPTVAKAFDIGLDVFAFEVDFDHTFAASVPAAKAVSRFPAVRRDIALVVQESVTATALVDAIRAASPDLVREVRVFDVYRGKGIEAGLKSIALGLILQETSRTLTDEDADAAVAAAVQKVKQDFDANLRD